MATDPELSLRLAKAVADLYGEAVANLLRIVAGRLARGIDQPGWAERKLDQLDQLRREAFDQVQVLSEAMRGEVVDAVRAGAEAGAGKAVAELRKAGADISVDATFAGSQRHAIDRLVRETATNLASTHTRILRSTLDVYRTAVAEAGAPQVLAGTITRRQAAQRVLDRWARSGVSGFTDRTGRVWTVESYAEMATRTAVGRAQVQGALDRFDEAGYDLVIVSDAGGECEACRPWEGEILSQSGDDQTYPSVAAATSAGLFHANCRHDVGLYVPGLTKPLTDTADPAGDAARQQQRYLERGVRRWKRADAVALDDQATAKARAKVSEWQGRLREHIEANDLKRLPYRESLGAR